MDLELYGFIQSLDMLSSFRKLQLTFIHQNVFFAITILQPDAVLSFKFAFRSHSNLCAVHSGSCITLLERVVTIHGIACLRTFP